MAFYQWGMIRVAAAAPVVSVADPGANAERICAILQECQEQDISLVVFPELSITGYTCGDLFNQASLLEAARDALAKLMRCCEAGYDGIAVVGLPWMVNGGLYNVAAVLHRGRLLGLAPKQFIPNYKEFYERRWFAPGFRLRNTSVTFLDQTIPLGTDLIFAAEDVPNLVLAVEICEDLWMPTPPSSRSALQGATVLVNPSASTELIGKQIYRKGLVASQSGRCLAAYVYAGSGVTESTTDVVFGGQSLIAENGTILAESSRFERDRSLVVTEVDLERLVLDRIRQGTFQDAAERASGDLTFRKVHFRLHPSAPPADQRLRRTIDPHPFVPAQTTDRDERCAEIFHIQVAGLAKRLTTLGRTPLTLGVSGGLDSTLALLAACKTLDTLGWPRRQLTGFYMPGFGSSRRSQGWARALIAHLGVTERLVDIRGLCLEEMKLLGHHPFGIDVTGLTVHAFSERLTTIPADQRHDLIFENVQARMRTNLLMNGGFVIGTGDLSELALGWCTYNGDHMSMYNPNVGIPKTLVRFLVRWVADHEMLGEAGQLLHDIANSIITPELLPAGESGHATQSTESSVGPYELQDFYLYHFLRFGFTPRKLLYLAAHAPFDQTFSTAELTHWLEIFLKRFFASQFKRSCLPDGPKVGSVSLSPRGDWRMPSDAAAAAWLKLD